MAEMAVWITEHANGEAPPWVRLAWVGLTLPCRGIINHELESPIGVLSKAAFSDSVWYWVVPQAEALALSTPVYLPRMKRTLYYLKAYSPDLPAAILCPGLYSP